ncbi:MULTISPECIES: nucleotide exchange factor GrpE [Blautia]|uniref:Protein GrpE n=3 Tax=Clostridia TaxID=186801 RepID=A0A8I0AI81_9FIRM|nr:MULTISPECIES: nucleotide exchange factor GrpE [Blautia]MBC5650581.1 nucleotide exchange factor GrpE [Blautia segnis]NSL03291.1 nucleotide exchange factor GrpE [Blautia glucerasea]RGF76322.1 nucleotide exchange factor GrpE [Ruminococcus sp. AF31-8BH]HCL10358.1 nucleotide exchange factor GrpE [Blautia sp.]
MNKEAEVQEEAVDIPVTDGSEEEAADTAQAAEEEASDDTAAPEETEQQPEEAESQKEPETKTKTSFFGKKKKEKDKFEQQIEDLTDRLKRSMAEFDNYRKRTEKEKSSMYIIGAKDIVEKMLPIVDNFERGLAQAPEDDPFAEGMKMIYKQMMTAFDEMGVKPIEAVGKDFDPNLHNAVMHVEDESVGENIVVEEFQKGYTYKDFVVRHSMVKVAN